MDYARDEWGNQDDDDIVTIHAAICAMRKMRGEENFSYDDLMVWVRDQGLDEPTKLVACVRRIK